VGTIVDDDPPAQLSIGDAVVTEGNSGTTNATIVVTLITVASDFVTLDMKGFKIGGGRRAWAPTPSACTR
jgi:hypothetical protein